MKRELRAVAAAGVLLALSTAAAPSAHAGSVLVDFRDGRSAARVETRQIDGVTYLSLVDLARGVGGARHWNPKTGKLTLAVGTHRIAISSDNSFATVDRAVRNLGRPVRLTRGAFWVPQSFIESVLGPAVNADVSWQPDARTFAFARLGPVVTSIGLESRADGTAVVLGLNELADFVAESAERGAIEVLVRGGRLVDSLAILEGEGLVSSVVIAQADEGVRADIAAAAEATSFEAELYHDPYRIEILVRSSHDVPFMTPALRERQGLLPEGRNVLGSWGTDIETVMIDPGHGGRDRGAIGPAGSIEKNAMLALARELSRALQGEGFYVFMTRSSDSYVPLDRRAELSNLATADVFLSLQSDAWHSRSANGFRVVYHAPAPPGWRPHGRSRGAGLRYVEETGAAVAGGGLEWNHVQDAFRDESRRLATLVHDRMADDLDVADRGVAARNLAVLAGCAMPAILIETGFISNGADEARLADEGFRRNMAQAIARGIADYRRNLTGRD